MPTKPIVYDPRTNRYRAPNGRFIRESAVRQALDSVLDASRENVRAASEALRAGQSSLSDWQRVMAAEVKRANVLGAMTARGGRNMMSPSDWGWTGQRVRVQLDFARNFAAEIASGKQPLNGTLAVRAQMYAEAGRATEREMERRLARQGGQAFERNVLGAADHCEGCLSQTRRGWVSIGSLVPVGQRTCRTRCRCHLIFRADPVRQEQAA